MSNFFKIIILSQALIYFTLIKAIYSLNTNVRTDIDADDGKDDTKISEVKSYSLLNDNIEKTHIRTFTDLGKRDNALYGFPDMGITAQLVSNYSVNTTSVNPEELGSYLEGDLFMSHRTSNRAFLKNGVISLSSRWPKGIVPFEIRGNFDSRDLATIKRATEEYHRFTCIRFVQHTNEPDYISIVNGNSGCWSSVGRIGGEQKVNLQSPGCLTKTGTAIHELMHALGFLHEQNRQERDSFVSILYQNIQRQAIPNFDKAAQTNTFGVPYDYGSVMHYSTKAFTTNGQPTIIAIQPGQSLRMGQREGLSVLDIEKLNKMYDCLPTLISTASSNSSPRPGPIPMPAPTPVPTPGLTSVIVSNFLESLITGLGLHKHDNLIITKI